MFFPEEEEEEQDMTAIKLLCRRCEVRETCLSHAISFEKIGFWAGTTGVERDEIRRERKISVRPIKNSHLSKPRGV